MKNKILYIKMLFTLMLIVWFSGIFSNALLPDNVSKIFPGFFIHKTYSLVCHQDPAKSFFIYGERLQVCARCTGIYAGGLIFAIIALFVPRMRQDSKKLLILSMIPMAADVFLYSAGIYGYSGLTAFTTGLILGSVSILYIFTGIEDYFSELKLNSNVQ